MAEVTGQTFQVGGTPRVGYAPITQADGSAAWDPSGGASGGLSTGTIVGAPDSPYAASPGETVLVDQSAGPVTVVLPDTPPDGSSVTVKNFQYYAGGVNETTVQAGGSDMFCAADDFTGGGSVQVPLNGQGITCWYAGTLTEWFITAGTLPLAQLAPNLGATMFTPANPAGTTDATGVMMGLGVTSSIRSPRAGAALVTVCGDVFNSTIADGATYAIRYGAGSAPANGDALIGASLGNPVQYTAAAANERTPFSITGAITGGIGQALWADLSVAAVTGGTATVENITILIVSFG